MRHAEFFDARKATGLDKPSCPGELVLEWSRSDPHYSAGPRSEHTVERYRCDLCLCYVVWDATAGRVLNVHATPDATQIGHALAGAGAGRA